MEIIDNFKIPISVVFEFILKLTNSLQLPLHLKIHIEKIRGDFNVLLLFILWTHSPAFTHASGRNETCLASKDILWGIQISEEF